MGGGRGFWWEREVMIVGEGVMMVEERVMMGCRV